MDAPTMCSGNETVVPGRLRGYRSWSLLDDQLPPTLTALNFRFGAWPASTMRAECHRPRLEFSGCSSVNGCHCGAVYHVELPEVTPPDKDCLCGLWGWYRPDESRLSRGHVFGAVDVYGKMQLGDYGFRAQYAQIVALAYDGPTEVAFQLGQRYHVPVFDTAAELAEQFPPQDVRELVPTAFSGGDYPENTYSTRSTIFQVAIDPYKCGDLTLGDEPLWHYQLNTVRSELFGLVQGGFTLELVSRFSEKRAVVTEPEITSLYVVRSPPPLLELRRPAMVNSSYSRISRELEDRREASRRSGAPAPVFQYASASPQPEPEPENPDLKKLALIKRRRSGRVGPQLNPFTRRGRRQ